MSTRSVSPSLPEAKRYDPFENEPYIRIPLSLLEYFDLNPRASLCFGLICLLSEQRGYSFASQAWLAKKLKISDRQLRDCIEALRSAGVISGTRRRNHVEYAPIPFRVENRSSSTPVSSRKSLSSPDRKETSDHDRWNLSSRDRKKTSDRTDQSEPEDLKKKREKTLPMRGGATLQRREGTMSSVAAILTLRQDCPAARLLERTPRRGEFWTSETRMRDLLSEFPTDADRLKGLLNALLPEPPRQNAMNHLALALRQQCVTIDGFLGEAMRQIPRLRKPPSFGFFLDLARRFREKTASISPARKINPETGCICTGGVIQSGDEFAPCPHCEEGRSFDQQSRSERRRELMALAGIPQTHAGA